jgi:hypothetical protein
MIVQFHSNRDLHPFPRYKLGSIEPKQFHGSRGLAQERRYDPV